MNNLKNQFQSVATQRGLHCVWVLRHEGNISRLAASWFTTEQEACESENEAVCAEYTEEEGREPWSGTHLRAA